MSSISGNFGTNNTGTIGSDSAIQTNKDNATLPGEKHSELDSINASGIVKKLSKASWKGDAKVTLGIGSDNARSVTEVLLKGNGEINDKVKNKDNNWSDKTDKG